MEERLKARKVLEEIRRLKKELRAKYGEFDVDCDLAELREERLIALERRDR